MSNNVNITVLPTSSIFKVLNITGEAGDYLKKHKVSINALLLVQKGTIHYEEANKQLSLSAGESLDIPIDILHEVTCVSSASFWVIMPQEAKMKFEK